jgi:hypothetical protein
MTLPLNRRDFLRRNAAAGLILGLPLLEGCDSTGGGEPRAASGLSAVGDELLGQARQRMKKEIKPGIVLVIPTDRAAAKTLATELPKALSLTAGGCAVPRVGAVKGGPAAPDAVGPCLPGDAALRRLLTRVVFVCLPADDVRIAFPATRPDAAAVLLDVAGKPVDQLASRADLYSKDFAAAMTKFVSGPKGEHAAAVRDAQREALGKAKAAKFDDFVRDLDSDRFAARETASKQLAETAPQTTALLAAAFDKAEYPEGRRRIDKIFEDLFLGAPAGTAGVRLPYGVEIDQPRVDPCPACGMAFVGDQAVAFVRFTAAPGGSKK